MKTNIKNKNIVILILMMAFTVCTRAQSSDSSSTTTSSIKMGLMPYIGFSRSTTQVEMLSEKENVTGYEVGAEYEWFKEKRFKSGTRLGLKNINADATSLFGTYEVEMNILTIGQSLSYDLDLGGHTIRPFTTVDFGVGLAKSSWEGMGDSVESDSKALPYAAVTAGIRYVIGDYIPFIQGGYQTAKLDDIGFAAFDNSTSTEVDYSGSFLTIGLGMVF